MEAEPVVTKTARILAYVRRRAFRSELATFGLGALAGRITITGNVSPFGIAFLTAASMRDFNVHYAFAGTVAGALLLQSVSQMQAAGAIAVYYILNLFWSQYRKNAEPYERYFLLLIAQAVLLPVFYADGWESLLSGLISVGASVLGVLVMQNALGTIHSLGARHVLTDTEQIGLSAFFGILLLSMTDAKLYGFSLPVVLLLLFSMTAALARGITGVAVSVALAAMLTVGGAFSLAFVGSLAACTLSGAVLRRTDTLGVLGGFIACSLLVGTYVFTASHTINLINLAVSGALFLMIPRDVMLQVCAYLDADKNRERYSRRSIKRIRDRTAEDMRRTATVCRDIARLFKPTEPEQEPTDALLQWMAQAAAGVCAGCPLSVLCWRDWQFAAETVSATLGAHERGERLRIRKPFDPTCKHMPQMAAAAWQAKNQYLVQCAMQRQTDRQYRFISRQMNGICDVLERMADRVQQDRWIDEALEHTIVTGLDRRGVQVHGVDALYPDGRLRLHVRVPAVHQSAPEAVREAVSSVIRRPMRLLETHTKDKQCICIMEEAQQFVTELGTAISALAGSGISGDSAGERRLEHGRVLFALSDGMGAGEAARLESEAAISLLFDLYSIGLDRDSALQSVNKLLLERKADMYATLDAVFLDLSSGYCEFIKYGAPPTFIKRGGKLHMVQSEALPAGIVPDAIPAVSTARLRKNDTVIMFSDGTLDALGEQTHTVIDDALRKAGSAREAAEAILALAKEIGQEDDMSVMVIKIA